MDIPKRPTPFAKLIDLGIHGQVLIYVDQGHFGATIFTATNAVRDGDTPVSAAETCASYAEAERKVAEYDEDDARVFIAAMKQHMTRKIGEKA